MKKIRLLFAITCLLLSSILHAQDCHFDSDEKDKFTGEIARKANQRLGSMTTHWNLILEQQGDKLFIGLKTIQAKLIESNIAKGDKFYLRLENGTVISIVADNTYSPSVYAANGGVQTTITVRGEVEHDAMKNLSESPITDIKLTVGGNDLTQSKIMDRQARKVMETATCLAK